MKQVTLLLFITLLFLALNSKAQYNYPPTKEIPVTDNYFDTKITDNYRWLEDLTPIENRLICLLLLYGKWDTQNFNP